MSRKQIVIVLHGPAGVGKDSVVDRLREKTGIRRATSSTTRPPRENEEDGVHYYFLTRKQFEAAIDRGEFVEWAHVYGDLKGVRRAEIDGPLARGEDLIIRTDVQGARTWREALTGAVSIFLMAGDRETLRRRLVKRGSESPETLAVRLAELDVELADIPNNDYVVMNPDGQVEEAVRRIEEIIERERSNDSRPPPCLGPRA